MKIFQLRLLCALLAFGLLFTACNSSTPSPGSTPDNAPAATDDSAPAPSEGGTISIMTAMAYGTEELDGVLEAFKAANGVEIDIQHVPNDYDQIIASRVNSGDIPDIFVQSTGSRTEQYSEYAYDFTDDPIVEKFNDSAIAVSKNAEGRLMSLPWTYESMAFIINQDIFDELGISEMPKTLDELEAVCKQIQEAGYTPFSTALKEKWVLAHIGSHFVAPEDSDAKTIIGKINSGELTFEGMKDFKNVFTLLDIMTTYGPSKPLEVDWEISENDLANKKTAIIHMGDWCEATLKEFNADYNVSFMPVPVGNDGTAPTFLSSISWQFLLHKDSGNLEKAKELLEFMLTSDEGIEWMTQGVKAAPSAKTDKKPGGILSTSAQEYINSGASLPWNHTLWPSGFTSVMGEELQRYMLGESTAQEVMETLSARW